MIDKPFIPSWIDLRAFSPELWIIAGIVAVLLTPFFTRRSNTACAMVAIASLAFALLAAVLVNVSDGTVGYHLARLMVVDHVAVLWKVLLYLFVIGVILMWFSTTAITMHEGDGPEFFALLLGATLGMSLMASTANLLMIFMCVEMASLPSYVLAGFRKTHRVGAEASLKYVLFGAATSAIMAYGLSFLYGLYGTLQVDEIARQMATSGTISPALLAVAVFGLIVGLGFKISAVPFHFWCPDVFEGASIDVSAFLSVASKGAALILLMRVLMVISQAMGFGNLPPTDAAAGISLTAIAVAIGILGSITATVGNTAAFVQNNIKRLLAYSSIAHAGYMLCALSLLLKHRDNMPATPAGPGLFAIPASQALLLYLAIYMFMNLGAFTIAGLIHRDTGSEDIRDYAALGRRNPLLAICMGVVLFSLVGMPPFAGFYAKLTIMAVIGANGGWWWALVAVIGLNTVFSLYYYARIIRLMYLVPSDKPEVRTNPLGLAISLLCAAMLLILFVGSGPLSNLTTRYGKVYLTSGAPAPTTSVAQR